MTQDERSSTHIKEVIDTLFTTSTVPINLDDTRIWKLWDGVVGKGIARHARPSSIKRGVLMVKVTDSVWLQDLEFQAETIKEKLNTRLQRQAIKKVRFRVGEPQESKHLNNKGPRKEGHQDLSLERQRETETTIARIKDEEIRSSFRKIMIAAKKESKSTSD